MNIEEAKKIPITDYLHSLGYSPVKQQGANLWYKSPLREEHEASFKVNTEREQWYDFGAGKGGNIIALAQELYCSDHLPYLLNRIAEQAQHVRPVSFSFRQQRSAPSFQHLEVRDLTHPALLRYLQGRGIDLICHRFPECGWRLRGAQLLFQRLHRTERHHPYPATGRTEGEVPGVRRLHGLSFIPHAKDKELPCHAQP